MMLHLAAITVMLAAGPVVRWSSPVPIEADEVGYSDEGVIVRPVGEVLPITVPWFDIRSIPDGWTGEAAAYKGTAQDARAARLRRLRGDIHGAGELYARLSASLDAHRGEQSLDIALGLLDLSMIRGEAADGVVPWLRVLEAAGPGRPNDGSGLDPSTGLHPSIIPLFQSTVDQTEPDFPTFSGREQILAEYYQLALQPGPAEEHDATLEELEKRARKLGDRDAGVLLVHEVVTATHASDPSTRRAAREQLSRTARTADEGWLVDWARLAVGASLLDEPQIDGRERGVVACIAVVVDPQEETPDAIRLLAAEFAAEYLRETNRDQYAAVVTMAAIMDDQPAAGATP